jgi:hypothetical protein
VRLADPDLTPMVLKHHSYPVVLNKGQPRQPKANEWNGDATTPTASRAGFDSCLFEELFQVPVACLRRRISFMPETFLCRRHSRVDP